MVDIHPPHGPIHSWKDFAIHLLTVVLGILIALSLEGLLQWRHHRAMAEEATQKLTDEIRHNRDVLAVGLTQAPDAEKRLKTTVEVIEAFKRNHREESARSFDWSFGLFELAGTAWSTAASTGALSYMEYRQLQGYTKIYILQEQLMTLQQTTFAKWLDLQKWGKRDDLKSGLSRLTAAELSEIEIEASAALVHTEAEESVARALMQQYTSIVGEK